MRPIVYSFLVASNGIWEPGPKGFAVGKGIGEFTKAPEGMRASREP